MTCSEFGILFYSVKTTFKTKNYDTPFRMYKRRGLRYWNNNPQYHTQMSRLTKQYSSSDLLLLVVANVLEHDDNAQVYNLDANLLYKLKGEIDSVEYYFRNALRIIREDNITELDDLIRYCIVGDIPPLTATIFCLFFSKKPHLDPLIEVFSQKLKNLSRFFDIDREKYRKIMQEIAE